MSYTKTDGAARWGLIPVFSLLVLLAGCLCGSHTMHPPDHEMFNADVASPTLRAQFDSAHLVPGMPYYVVDQVFVEWKNDKHRPVPGIGSRQELREEEGWGRIYHDPHIKTFMQSFNTPDGEVTVWYGYSDFYRAGVIAGDSLTIFGADSSMSSMICCLLGPGYLSTTDSIAAPLVGDTVFAEIRHLDNPRYPVSYWYRVLVEDAATFYLNPTGYDLYRVEQIEVDGDRVDFFLWRSGDENR